MIDRLIEAGKHADALSTHHRLSISLEIHSSGVHVEGNYYGPNPERRCTRHREVVAWELVDGAPRNMLMSTIDRIHRKIETHWREDGAR